MAPRCEIDVFFAGRPGVGKSSLINMTRGIPDHSEVAARVSHNGRPCTAHTTPYSSPLESCVHCRLWDTPGLDHVTVEDSNHHFMAKLVDWIRQPAFQQPGLTEETRAPIRKAGPILVWCIDAITMDAPTSWKQFRDFYAKHCDRNVVPVIVVTRMPADTTGWEVRCRNQLQQSGFGVWSSNNITLLRVRRHRGTSSLDYIEDSKALRNVISRLAILLWFGILPTGSWKDFMTLPLGALSSNHGSQKSIKKGIKGPTKKFFLL